MINKLLSLIVPSYNMEQYLPKCLGSLILDDADLLQKLDVIVVNDGSKDRTSEIAHEFEKKYPGVFCVIDKANGHYGSCINAALPLAKGRFVKILDADDWYDTAALSEYLKQLESFGENPPDVIFTDYLTVYEDGKVAQVNTFPFQKNVEFTIDEVLPYAHNVYMHGVTYRTCLFEGLNYHQKEGICYTDTEWMFLPLASAKKFWYCDVSLYRYLIGRAGQSADINVVRKSQEQYFQLLGDMVAIYESHKESIPSSGRAYMLVQLLRLGRLIYWMNLAQSTFSSLTALFGQIDGRMKEVSSWFYRAVGELDYCCKWFGKRHIAKLRRFGRCRWFYLLYLRVWTKFYSIVGVNVGETPFVSFAGRI